MSGRPTRPRHGMGRIGTNLMALAMLLAATVAAKAETGAVLPDDAGARLLDQSVVEQGEMELPASALAATGHTDARDNQVFAAPANRRLAGRIVRSVVLAAPGRQPLDLHRFYLEAIRVRGGEVVYGCTSRTCGGDISGGVDRGSSRTGLLTVLYPPDPPPADEPGLSCTLRGKHRNQRYALAELPGAVHVAVLTFAVDAKAAAAGCETYADRAVAITITVEPEARDLALVAPAAGEAPAAAASPAAPRPRVFIHHAARDVAGAELAGRLAEYLPRQGFEVAAVRVVGFRITSGGIRYFFTSDRAAAGRLAATAGSFVGDDGQRLPRAPADFTHYAPKPRPGTLEIWLAGG